MKKLLASALLAGLLLGTTSPVFAAEGTTNQTINVTSSIAATYEVTIPSDLSINLTDAELSNNTGAVTLVNLTAAGSILVVPAITDLTLTGGTSLSNETLDTTLTDGADTPIDPSGFSLTNTEKVQNISVETDELSENNKPGAYTGSIIFNISYVEAVAE